MDTFWKFDNIYLSLPGVLLWSYSDNCYFVFSIYVVSFVASNKPADGKRFIRSLGKVISYPFNIPFYLRFSSFSLHNFKSPSHFDTASLKLFLLKVETIINDCPPPFISNNQCNFYFWLYHCLYQNSERPFFLHSTFQTWTWYSRSWPWLNWVYCFTCCVDNIACTMRFRYCQCVMCWQFKWCHLFLYNW